MNKKAIPFVFLVVVLICVALLYLSSWGELSIFYSEQQLERLERFAGDGLFPSWLEKLATQLQESDRKWSAHRYSQALLLNQALLEASFYKFHLENYLHDLKADERFVLFARDLHVTSFAELHLLLTRLLFYAELSNRVAVLPDGFPQLVSSSSSITIPTPSGTAEILNLRPQLYTFETLFHFPEMLKHFGSKIQFIDDLHENVAQFRYTLPRELALQTFASVEANEALFAPLLTKFEAKFLHLSDLLCTNALSPIRFFQGFTKQKKEAFRQIQFSERVEKKAFEILVDLEVLAPVVSFQYLTVPKLLKPKVVHRLEEDGDEDDEEEEEEEVNSLEFDEKREAHPQEEVEEGSREGSLEFENSVEEEEEKEKEEEYNNNAPYLDENMINNNNNNNPNNEDDNNNNNNNNLNNDMNEVDNNNVDNNVEDKVGNNVDNNADTNADNNINNGEYAMDNNINNEDFPVDEENNNNNNNNNNENNLQANTEKNNDEQNNNNIENNFAFEEQPGNQRKLLSTQKRPTQQQQQKQQQRGGREVPKKEEEPLTPLQMQNLLMRLDQRHFEEILKVPDGHPRHSLYHLHQEKELLEANVAALTTLLNKILPTPAALQPFTLFLLSEHDDSYRHLEALYFHVRKQFPQAVVRSIQDYFSDEEYDREPLFVQAVEALIAAETHIFLGAEGSLLSFYIHQLRAPPEEQKWTSTYYLSLGREVVLAPLTGFYCPFKKAH